MTRSLRYPTHLVAYGKQRRQQRKIDVEWEYKRQTSSRVVRECFNLGGIRAGEKSIFFLMEKTRKAGSKVAAEKPNLFLTFDNRILRFVSALLTCMEIRQTHLWICLLLQLLLPKSDWISGVSRNSWLEAYQRSWQTLKKDEFKKFRINLKNVTSKLWIFIQIDIFNIVIKDRILIMT